MRIALVSPPYGELGKKGIIAPVAPPALEYLAALTLKVNPDTEVILIDANREEFNPNKIEADLVGFSVHTIHAPWVYHNADIIRQRGIRVVMGGMHVSALPDEALPHTDALVIGEAESEWAAVLRDLRTAGLKPVYQARQLPLNDLPWPKTDLLPHKYILGSFFSAKGCPGRCRFCSVNRFFHGKVRFRPVEEVVREVAASTRTRFWNLDDNCWGTSVPRSIELFKELALNLKGKTWFGMGDLRSLDHQRADELLKSARESGLTYVRVGWESENPGTLEYYNAHDKQGRDRRDAIKRIRAAGIDVMLFVIVGSRMDTRKDFEKVVRLSDELDVAVRPVMMTPHPDTELFREYRPYLLPGYGWDKFDGIRTVFEHPEMPPEERDNALLRLWSEMYTLPKILKRLTKISAKGFPQTHISSFMIQYNESRPFKKMFKGPA